ncbi:MAG: 2-succinyl-6-hydroxy-2,4-cyclohexadiene-1-carboxylate synthase [Chloroflexi bacterium]|nr:2-succinyl-6-hydroxy-2,4-cyclohexadiene-1-carboxylate synthase [Chloroflexota bacterium]
MAAARHERLLVRSCTYHVTLAGSGPPLLLLHGFTGSAETWEPFIPTWGAHSTLIAVDLLGHGRSDCPPDPTRYRIDQCAADLLGLLDQLGIARTDLLGYSMGGRVALHLAVAAPDRIGALVLESSSPGLASPAERAARVQSDEALATLLEREGIAAFVARWEALPLFASQRRLPAAVRDGLRHQRLQNHPLGLANSLRGLGAGVMEPLYDRLGAVRAPTLLVVGALDERYRALGEEVAGRLPQARLVVIPEAGHTVHLEQPAAFGRVVSEFLASCRGGSEPAGGAESRAPARI